MNLTAIIAMTIFVIIYIKLNQLRYNEALYKSIVKKQVTKIGEILDYVSDLDGDKIDKTKIHIELHEVLKTMDREAFIVNDSSYKEVSNCSLFCILCAIIIGIIGIIS